MAKPTSKTQGSYTNLAGSKVHKTTVTDSSGNKTTGYGHTSEQSQKTASNKADKKK